MRGFYVRTEEIKLKNRLSNLGRRCSDEHKQKIGLANKGKKRTEEQLKRMSISHIGIHAGEKNPNFGRVYSDEERRNLSLKLKGKGEGIPKSEEHKKKLSDAHKGKHKREQNNNWKGGITKLENSIRSSLKYSEWVKNILSRDNYTCRQCQRTGIKLEAHHVKPFNSIIQNNRLSTLEDAWLCQELWDLNNGLTLCKKCHAKTSTRRKC